MDLWHLLANRTWAQATVTAWACHASRVTAAMRLTAHPPVQWFRQTGLMALIRTTGYVQLRRGLFEHVSRGKITALECFIYLAIISNADPSNGTWLGSAGLLAALFSLSERTCRDILEKLEKKGYLKRFPVPGKHGSYPILVHKFECSQGAAKGQRLNAFSTMIWDAPVFEVCEEDGEQGVEHNGEENVEHSAAKYKRLETRDLRPELVKRPMRLPAEFSPNLDHQRIATELGLDLADQMERFRDYWNAKAGKDAVKLDWDATLRNWLRNAIKHSQPNGSKGYGKLSKLEQMRRDDEELFGRAEEDSSSVN